jgi:hypothetical protein
MGKKKARRDGGEMVLRSFDEMCARLDFMNRVLNENHRHMQQDHINYVIDNAYSIEQEWILDPKMRSPGNGGLDEDDYTEYMNDA